MGATGLGSRLVWFQSSRLALMLTMILEELLQELACRPVTWEAALVQIFMSVPSLTVSSSILNSEDWND